MAEHNVVGAEGELVAGEFLESKGLKIIERNFRRLFGEIDIVAKDSTGEIVFVEVKTVSWETGGVGAGGVPHETHRPEDNIHQAKMRRLSKAIQIYLVSRGIEEDWRFDVVTVQLDRENKKAKVKWLQDIILES